MNNFLNMRRIIDFGTAYFNARGKRACDSSIVSLWCGPDATIDHIAALLVAEGKGQHA